MPIRDDLILRMLDQIGEVAARVITGQAPGSLAEAERELASAYRELTGSGRALVARLSSEQLLAILGAPNHFHRERGYLLARLLELDASLLVAGVQTGAPARADGIAAGADEVLAAAAVNRLKALDLLLEAASAGLDEEDLEERIAGLEAALASLELPQASHWRRFEHAVASGRFAAAEDLLFEGLEHFGPEGEAAPRGRAFYRELLARSDAELEAGALPRDELAEGLEELESRLGGSGAPSGGPA